MSHLVNRVGKGGTAQIRAKLHEVSGDRGKTWFFSYNLRGRRIRSTRYKDRDVAAFAMRKIVDQYEAQTPYQATTLTREQLDDAQGAFLTLRDNKVGKTLGEIVSWYVSKGPRCLPITLTEAADRFLRTLNSKDMRPRTIKFYNNHLTGLKKAFGGRQLSELTTDDFRVYLNNPAWGIISQWHHRQVASMLYLWAMAEKPPLASENPLDPLPKMTKKSLRKVLHAPIVVAPTDVKAWLRAALQTPHLPFTILSFFAGMRRYEIEQFAKLPNGGWDQISFQAGSIDIPPGVGKTGKRVIVMHSTLVAWLKWLQKKGRTQFLAPNINKGLRAVKRQVFPPAADGTPNQHAKEGNLARHSYISYSLRLPGASFAQVAMNAGNTEQVIKEHYNDLQVTSKQAEEYWLLTPRTLRV
jgi:hypothetical protein